MNTPLKEVDVIRTALGSAIHAMRYEERMRGHDALDALNSLLAYVMQVEGERDRLKRRLERVTDPQILREAHGSNIHVQFKGDAW